MLLMVVMVVVEVMVMMNEIARIGEFAVDNAVVVGG